MASEQLNWQIGGINTLVLLISSLTMVLGVYLCPRRPREAAGGLLAGDGRVCVLFLLLKGYEYYDDYEKGLILGSRFQNSQWLEAGLSAGEIPHVKLFLLFYWIMTGAHALHMTIGIAAVLIIAALSARRHFDAHYYGPVEVVGLYWHFIDIVWIFLVSDAVFAGNPSSARQV